MAENKPLPEPEPQLRHESKDVDVWAIGRFGIGLALLGVLPVLYLNAVVALLAVFVTRGDFNLSTAQFASLAFELIVCPALAANLNKRLIDRTRLMPSTLRLIGHDEGLLRRVNANLEYLHVAPTVNRPGIG